MKARKPMGDFWKALLASALIFGLSGCASTGEFRGQGTVAGVTLEKKNYKIIKVAAKGESTGFRFLGISILRQSRRYYDCWPLKGA